MLKYDFLSVYYKFSLVFDRPGQVNLQTAWNNAKITKSDLALTGLLTHTPRNTHRNTFCIPFLDIVNQESSKSCSALPSFIHNENELIAEF